MNSLVIIISFLVVIGIILFLTCEKYMSTNMGTYGQMEGPACSQKDPEIVVNTDAGNHVYLCRACSQSCSSKESWDNCKLCMTRMNNLIPGVV